MMWPIIIGGVVMATKVSGEQYYGLDGQLLEIKRQLRQEDGYPFDPEELKNYLQTAIEGRFSGSRKRSSNKFLRLISSSVSLTVDAADGTEILADAKDVFPGGIDSDFINWGADEPGRFTAETPVDVYEMTQDATFSQMFEDLSSDVRRLCLTQHQIKNFVKKNRSWLRTEGYATFFLFESKGHFFVASVDVHSGGRLYVSVRLFGSAHVWDAELRRRLVVPKLA